MEEILAFLRELKQANNREWFEANRARYKQLSTRYNAFVEELIVGITVFDPSVAGVTLRDCTYRINRDIRFSPNKEPYKTHIGAYVAPHGKKSGYAGYYFHLEPDNCLLAVGLYCPEPKVLKSVREEIADRGDELVVAMKKANGWELDRSNQLKRIPKGFAPDSVHEDLLRLRDFSLMRPFEPKGNLLPEVLNAFAQTVEINRLLNKAVAYAQHEM